MISQVWENTKYKLIKEEKFRGQVIKDPYKVELNKPINDSYSGIGYKAHLQVHDIKVLSPELYTVGLCIVRIYKRFS